MVALVLFTNWRVIASPDTAIAYICNNEIFINQLTINMKTAQLLLFLCSFFCIVACKKTTHLTTSPASVTVVNGVQGSNTIIPVFGTDPLKLFAAAKSITYGNLGRYSLVEGEQPLYMVRLTDTLKPFYSNNLSLAANTIYSLFVAGDSTKPDVVFVEDMVPVISDSTCGVRFINLSRASLPIKVNIRGNGATKPEVSNIAYKQISDFKLYDAKANKKTYIFEVRNEADGALLLTYTWTFSPYKSHTLAFTGTVNAAGKPATLKMFPVNNF